MKAVFHSYKKVESFYKNKYIITLYEQDVMDIEAYQTPTTNQISSCQSLIDRWELQITMTTERCCHRVDVLN